MLRKTEIYVQLLEDELGVYRPVKAQHLGGNIYKIIKPSDFEELDETWEFEPGTVVICKERQGFTGTYLAAVEKFG